MITRKVLAVFAIACGVLTAATVPAQAAAENFCHQSLDTGKVECFDTEAALRNYEAGVQSITLVTMFNGYGAKGASGYRNFASAYGRDYCTLPADGHEGSSGDLRQERYNTGVALDRTISSVVVRPGVNCVLWLADDFGFRGNTVILVGGTCADLRTCTGGGNWDNRARSFYFT
ncbi:hypothetical protein V1227_05910 [Lentzea sp. DG1S-22]|uniref:hypothetical protein n=1 Tax=Lentzea sp. DG1S-22 TaxID=3108822 RepID=UPI002E75D03C|nr:hypothetical protein [Lentzea sp. DG1S-22]WVH82294.1 hypothetical protein V1227_05910 [Lentzea sp. DG1S-22]